MNLSKWSSLTPQIALAERLFGSHGSARVAQWLDQQKLKITDPDFARQFSDHITLPNIVQGDYNHRLVHTPHGKLIGGIRFYGRDVTRPFVEVIAHTFDESSEGMAALVDAVASEWCAFTPLHLRLLLAPHVFDPLIGFGQNVLTDMTVHIARHADMTPPDGRIMLARFSNIEAAIALIRQRYADVAAQNQNLSRNINAADPEALLAWQENDQLRAICVEGKTIGLLSIVPGSIEWIEAGVVHEEVITSAHTGHGYAASAQAAWAANASNPNDFMIGTIDRLNHASRLSAKRAGRPALLTYVFVPLIKK